MILKLDILFFVLGTLCWKLFFTVPSDESTIRNIVYSRTEAILLLERIADEKTTNPQLVEKVLSFYIDSQPYILELCKDKKLNIQADDFEIIDQQVDLKIDKIRNDDDLIALLNVYIQQSIAQYSQLVADKAIQKDLKKYCLLVLPQLLELNNSIQSKSNHHYCNSPKP